MAGLNNLKNPVIPDAKQSKTESNVSGCIAKLRQCGAARFVLDAIIQVSALITNTIGFYVKPLQRHTKSAQLQILRMLNPEAVRLLEPKPVKRTVLTEFITSAITDSRGYALGGAILSVVDISAGICARIHGEMPAVTASVDAVHLLHPFKTGEIAIVSAALTRAWSSSMEVVVDVECENLQTGVRRLGCRAYLTFVALKNGRPSRVPPLMPITPEEEERFEAADARKKARILARDSQTEAFGPIMSHYQHLYYQSIDPSTEAGKLKDEKLKPAAAKRKNVKDVFGKPDKSDASKISPDLFESGATNIIAVGPLMLESQKAHTMGASYSEMVQIVMPQHANTYQITFGGNILKWLEASAHISASRHTHTFITTASLDEVQFKRPTYVGDYLIIRSIVSCSFTHSLEIYVSVERQDATGGRTFTNEAFVTMVAVDEQGKPVPVPTLLPQNKQEEKIMQQALERKKVRDEQRRKVKQWADSFNKQMDQRLAKAQK